MHFLVHRLAGRRAVLVCATKVSIFAQREAPLQEQMVDSALIVQAERASLPRDSHHPCVAASTTTHPKDYEK